MQFEVPSKVEYREDVTWGDGTCGKVLVDKIYGGNGELTKCEVTQSNYRKLRASMLSGIGGVLWEEGDEDVW